MTLSRNVSDDWDERSECITRLGEHISAKETNITGLSWLRSRIFYMKITYTHTILSIWWFRQAVGYGDCLPERIYTMNRTTLQRCVWDSDQYCILHGWTGSHHHTTATTTAKLLETGRELSGCLTEKGQPDRHSFEGLQMAFVLSDNARGSSLAKKCGDPWLAVAVSDVISHVGICYNIII